jgi:hypothetical protein
MYVPPRWRQLCDSYSRRFAVVRFKDRDLMLRYSVASWHTLAFIRTGQIRICFGGGFARPRFELPLFGFC